MQANPLLQVRTFNTAPLQTTHHKIFTDLPYLLSRFVNYRLSSDLVSDLPLQTYKGNTFVFPCEQWSFTSHNMAAIRKHVPAEIFKLEVGSSEKGSAVHNLLVEMTHGVLSSYQCRVEGQFFSRFRAGAKNLSEMQQVMPEIIELIEQKHYDQAIIKLVELKGKLNGHMSCAIVDVLMLSTNNVKISQQMISEESKDKFRQQQLAMKTQLREALEAQPGHSEQPKL